MCSYASGSGEGLASSRWTEQRILLSGFEFVFRVPGGESSASPSLPTISKVDLGRDLPKDRPSLVVYGHSWDWEGWFWQGVFGTLTMHVAVIGRPDDYSKDLMALENLEELIDRNLTRTLGQHNEELRQKGVRGSVVTPPEAYKRVTLHDRTWLVYSLVGQDRTTYVTPLTPTRYLGVVFFFVDNSRAYKTTWRREAQPIADQIAKSLELRKAE